MTPQGSASVVRAPRASRMSSREAEVVERWIRQQPIRFVPKRRRPIRNLVHETPGTLASSIEPDRTAFA